MKRWQQKCGNQKTIDILKKLILIGGQCAPCYEKIVGQLNTLGYTTSRGNHWTAQRLLRMLQRNSISGLDGLRRLTQASNAQS